MDIALDMVVIDCDRYDLAILSGEIDAYTAPSFRRRVFDAIGERPLILDMGGVTFCDCAGLRVFVAAARRCREGGVDLALTGLRPRVEQLFRLARIDQVVPVCSRLQDAVWCVVPLSDEEIGSWPWPDD